MCWLSSQSTTVNVVVMVFILYKHFRCCCWLLKIYFFHLFKFLLLLVNFIIHFILFHIPYQNIRSLVYISRKYAANLQPVCGLYLRRVCCKRVFRMQITFLAHCSCTQCASQVCSTQLSRTVLAHNVRRKFAAHSCCTLYWHTMCAKSMQRTVVAHYSGTQCAPQVWGALLSHTILVCLKFAAHSCRALRCSAPPTPTPPSHVYHPHCHIFLF